MGSTMDYTYQCPPDYQIIGIFGHAENEVDALGVYISTI